MKTTKTKKKAVKQSPRVYDTYAKPATVEPLVHRYNNIHQTSPGYIIYDRDLPSVIQKLAYELLMSRGTNRSALETTKALLQSIGIGTEVEGRK